VGGDGRGLRLGGHAMSDGTGIEWCDATWNPVSGCTRASPGCDNCYAVTMTHRLEAMGQAKYAGLTVLNNRGERHFSGKVRCHEDALTIPLSWRKPRRIFVNSMSDLFHREVPDRFIRLVHAAMSYAGQHTFLVLTKRPERAAQWYADEENSLSACQAEWLVADIDDKTPTGKHRIGRRGSEGSINGTRRGVGDGNYWPLPNVWLGASAEDQTRLDERLPHLLKCPAAVRWLSCEPLLGPLDLGRMLYPGTDFAGVQWVVVGGESGKGARVSDIAWHRSLLKQCREAGVAYFEKQLGTKPYDGDVEFCRFRSFEEWVNKARSWLGGVNSAGQRFMPKMRAVCVDQRGRVCEIGRDFMRARDEGAFSVHCHEIMPLRDRKGGTMEEWPADLRVREMPRVAP
jgi:protein gp37